MLGIIVVGAHSLHLLMLTRQQKAIWGALAQPEQQAHSKTMCAQWDISVPPVQQLHSHARKGLRALLRAFNRYLTAQLAKEDSFAMKSDW